MPIGVRPLCALHMLPPPPHHLGPKHLAGHPPLGLPYPTNLPRLKAGGGLVPQCIPPSVPPQVDPPNSSHSFCHLTSHTISAFWAFNATSTHEPAASSASLAWIANLVDITLPPPLPSSRVFPSQHFSRVLPYPLEFSHHQLS
ncbi:hypothetical protein BOTBODRAFT_32846 [Botryobasidium botryosum FD-172 SS1]|uniref:Uncharacterized protein n=1 Tax=Botryobasidium botryosum (strain FD-172 SS1) TaxID=930990 RepID=A0A067MI63_BOTB1|nr:hypothetical protein BOTBODRAFT_32846 [Botryobasidium botryosum FD-172 SS1]